MHTLIDIFNKVRQRVWARQPASFFDLARIDMDGTQGNRITLGKKNGQATAPCAIFSRYSSSQPAIFRLQRTPTLVLILCQE